MTSRSRQNIPLRSHDEDPPIAETIEERTKNAMEYCQPPRNWSLGKAAEKAGISVGTLRG